MNFFELIKVIIFGIVEGITEWLPISSTGHMILLEEFLKLDVSPAFFEMFIVLIQLGAIFAVVILFWKKLWPFGYKGGKILIKKEIFSMWFKVLVASIPAAFVGILWGDELDVLFYNYQTVGLMLIIFGVLFILVENKNKGKKPTVTTLSAITYKAALIIGVWQLVAAVFPGTSRSGATIIGALLIGLSRSLAAEFTFFLAIPAMLGASLIKLIKFGGNFSTSEIIYLILGMAVAFIVSVIAIKTLMAYIKKHDFKVFAWYRIILGVIVLAYFTISLALKGA